MSAPRPPERLFTENEAGVVAGLIRGAIRKLERNAASSRTKYGDEYDSSAHDSRRAILRSAYEALGRDPDGISQKGGQDDG